METTAQNFSRSPKLVRTYVTLMTGRIAILSAAVLLLGLWVPEVSARGRSFPAEITGTIRSFDESIQTFTIQVDEPARVFTIAVGRDCEFKEKGAPTGEEILKQGARVKVSYFATIFTGKIAVDIAINPVPKISSGIIESIAPAERTLDIRLADGSRPLRMRWALNARFYKGNGIASAAELREDEQVKVSYFSPAFEAKYAVKIELERAS